MDPDIRVGVHESIFASGGANLICFPVSHHYFFVGGAKVYSQTGCWGHGRCPWTCHWLRHPNDAKPESNKRCTSTFRIEIKKDEDNGKKNKLIADVFI